MNLIAHQIQLPRRPLLIPHHISRRTIIKTRRQPLTLTLFSPFKIIHLTVENTPTRLPDARQLHRAVHQHHKCPHHFPCIIRDCEMRRTSSSRINSKYTLNSRTINSHISIIRRNSLHFNANVLKMIQIPVCSDDRNRSLKGGLKYSKGKYSFWTFCTAKLWIVGCIPFFLEIIIFINIIALWAVSQAWILSVDSSSQLRRRWRNSDTGV